MMIHKGDRMFTILAAAGLCFLATFASARPSSAETICVAIIEPEVSADLPPAERRALAASLDAVLARRLADQSGLVLVDRQALDRVLEERAREAAGLVAVAPGEVAAPLRPFWAAGVLVCSQVDAKAGAVVVEAVSAQTGQVLAVLSAKLTDPSPAAVAEVVEPRVEALVRDMHRGIARLHQKPLLEISGRLAGGLSRLAWMVDDLAEAAGARVLAGDEAALLVPRHPIATKEERLLRVMGLADAREQDGAAGLSPAPDIRFSFELDDSAKPGVAFENTPIRLKLSLRRADEPPVEIHLDGEVGRWDDCRRRAVEWLGRQLATIDGGHPAEETDDQARARQLAAEELAAVAPWAGMPTSSHIQLNVQHRIARHALRAAHLDPTDEMAAFLVARYVHALYPREGKNGEELSLAAMERAMVESRRYLDRFPKRNAERHLFILSHAGRMGVYATGKVFGGRPPNDAILHPPDVRLYSYVGFYVRTWAEEGYLGRVDERYNVGNSFAAFSFNLINHLVPCIPDEKLDEEHEYWRTFYATKVEPFLKPENRTDFLNTRPAPWDLVEAAFQARKRNPGAVRAAFQRLAAEYPANVGPLWGGDQWTPSRVPMFLKAAGDPDWETWKPDFTAPQPRTIELDQMTAFMAGLAGRSMPAWELDGAEPVPAVPLTVPEAVRAAGREEGSRLGDVEALFVAGGDVWLIAPASSIGSGRSRNRLFAAELTPPADGSIALDPVEIAWPEKTGDSHQSPGAPIFETACVTEEEGLPTVWMATQAHGLARFEKSGGRWQGRWYTQADGFPTDAIDHVARCLSGDRRLLLLASSTRGAQIMPDGSEKPDRPTYVWTLDPKTGEVKLLLDGSRLEKPLRGLPAAVTENGTQFHTALVGRDEYELDVKQMRSFVPSPFSYRRRTTDFVRDENGRLRLLRIWWDGQSNRLDEISLETFEPLRHSPGRGGARYSVFPFPECRHIFGMVFWWQGETVMVRDRWPSVYGELVCGRGPFLWIGFTRADAHGSTSRYLVAYRPAPAAAADWHERDLWVGPFRVPDQGTIAQMAPFGEDGLLLTTTRGIYAVDGRRAIDEAVRAGRAGSTGRWRAQYEQRLQAAVWNEALPVLLRSQKWDEAARLLDAEEARLRAAPPDWNQPVSDVHLWRAHLLARRGDLAAAERLYEDVARQAAADRNGPVEVFATMNRIVVLFHAQRYREMLDLCEHVNRRFPQTVPRFDGEGVGRYVNEARKKLAMQDSARPPDQSD